MSQLSLQEFQSLFPDLLNGKHTKDGGQKQVFVADHKAFGSVVVKILKNVKSIDRLAREIDAVIIIGSKNVPLIHDHGKKDLKGDTYHYIIEQRVEGEDLEVLIQRGVKFSTAQILECLETLLEICLELEKRKIVHRDIKPSNVILDKNGKFWLLDFGIARYLDLVSLTDTNAQSGPHTPGYAAPELFRNMKKDIDGRADLFGIGITIYEMITGQNPFTKGAQSPLQVLRNTETMTLPMLTIPGDTQNQLAGFISILGDKHISRRPRSIQEAFDWFKVLKPTINI